MCGFAGYLDPTARDLGEDRVIAMARELRHRGPDDEGYWLDPRHGLALGHQRLSILDVSPTGHQPMVSASGRFVIALNGEIYNHAHLRTQVGDVEFRGQSDTEALLAYIDRFGLTAALGEIEGMFAFALWDREDAVLYLARDRVGEKPLYYGRLGRSVAFASELRALRRHPGWRAEVDQQALAGLLRDAAISAPRTIYRDIYQLLPGHVVAIDNPDAEFEAVSFWSCPERQRSVAQGTPFARAEEAIEATETCLREILDQQLICDVPIGAFLSGGIDSSTVAALAQSQSETRLRTFSIGFDEAGFDEASDAAAVAQHLGTDHQQLYVTAADALSVVPQLAQIYDEPFADSSQIPTVLLSRLTRQHVTVALSGDGADEVFGGYSRYAAGLNAWRSTQALPAALRASMRTVVGALSEPTWDRLLETLAPVMPARLRYAQGGDKLRKLAALSAIENEAAYYRRLTTHWTAPADVLRHQADYSTADRQRWLEDFSAQMMLWDLQGYLNNDILTKVDRASMSVGLEVRCPFVDRRLIELSWQIPQAMKINNGVGKWVLRQVLNRHVPPQLTERPKRGFAVPLGRWLKGPLRDWAETQLDPHRVTTEGFFQQDKIDQLWRSHQNGEQDHQRLLWPILMFQAWVAEHGTPA